MIAKGVILFCIIAMTQAMFFPRPFPPKRFPKKFPMPRPIVHKKFIPIYKPVEVKVPHRVPVYIEKEVKVPVYIDRPVAVGGAGAIAGASAGAIAGAGGLDIGFDASINDADHVTLNIGGIDTGAGAIAGASAGASAGAIAAGINDNGFDNGFNNFNNNNDFNDFNNGFDNGFAVDGQFLDSGVTGVIGGGSQSIGGGVQDQFIQQHHIPAQTGGHGSQLPHIPSAKDITHF